MTAAQQLPDKQDWTVKDLAGLPEGLLYELIDGRLILPSPTPFQRLLGVELVLMLRPNCPSVYVSVPNLSLGVELTIFRPGRSGAYEMALSTNKAFDTDLPYPITIDVPALTALRDKCLAAQDHA